MFVIVVNYRNDIINIILHDDNQLRYDNEVNYSNEILNRI